MQDEHFDTLEKKTFRSYFNCIAVVEMMAAGLIVIAHDSAGPKMDII